MIPQIEKEARGKTADRKGPRKFSCNVIQRLRWPTYVNERSTVTAPVTPSISEDHEVAASSGAKGRAISPRLEGPPTGVDRYLIGR